MATNPETPASPYQTEKRIAQANALEIEQRADFYKAKAGFVWIAAAWLAIAPVVTYVTWLVIR